MSDIKIAPSILAADYTNLEKEISIVSDAGAEYLHIDVMDGNFVPSISYGPDWVKQIKPETDMVLDVHLMVQNPEKMVDVFADAGADIIGVHVEATQHIHRVLQMIKNKGKKAEVVINPGTPVSAIEPILYYVDQVLVMTVNPGFGGQKFLDFTMDKVKEISDIKKKNNYNFDIEVDGGINNETAVLAKNAGANVFVAGSYVYDKINPIEKIKTLKNTLS